MDKNKMKAIDFTQGPILGPLLKFMLPVLFALFLQSMYGAVDLLIVGKFGTSADVSAVSTGTQIMMTITNLANAYAMGLTILLGHQIGSGMRQKGGETIGAGIFEFIIIGAVTSVLMFFFAGNLSALMQAPEEAFVQTTQYVRICGSGFLIIMAYTLFGSIFRGIGDSVTPLIAVGIACVINIAGDLFLVAGLHMGTRGAAIATLLAQLISVILSLLLLKRRQLPFDFDLKMIKWDGSIAGRITKLGAPLAIQDLLVSISFLVILAIVNSLGVIISAGVGVAEKVCAFVMLVPSAFSQSVSAFTAQNTGAGKYDRTIKALKYAIALSLCAGFGMFFLNFFHGDLLTGLFSNDPQVVLEGWNYLKAYAIDCMLTAFLFCFLGFYNGMGLTRFVMIQGIVGAFGVRIPVAFFMSRLQPVSVFRIGLATPCSTILQVILCMVCLIYVRKKITLPPKH